MPQNKLGTLVLEVAAKTAKVERDMGKLRKQMSSFARGLARDNKKLNTTLKHTASRTSMVVDAMKLYLGLQAARFLKDQILAWNDQDDAIRKLSISTGIATEKLSAYQFQAERGGATLQTFTVGIKRAAKGIEEASRGTGDAARGFKRLGIDIRDSEGKLKDVDKVIREVANRFESLEDGTLKNATAQQIFGRSGEQLIPVLNGGAAAMENLDDKVKKAGVTLSEFSAKQAEDFNDTLRDMKLALEGVAKKAVRDFVLGFNFVFGDLKKVVAESTQAANMIKKLERRISQLQAQAAKGLRFEGGAIDLQQFERTNQVIANLQERIKNLRQDVKDLGKPLDDIKIPILEGEPEQQIERLTEIMEMIIQKSEQVNNQLGRTKEGTQLFKIRTEQAALFERRLKAVREEIERLKKEAKDIDEALAGSFKKAVKDLKPTDMTKEIIAAGQGMLDMLSEIQAREKELEEDRVAAIDRATEAYRRRVEQMRQLTNSWIGEATASFEEFARTGKISFSNLVDSMLSDLVRLASRRSLNTIFEGLLSGLFNVGGGNRSRSDNSGREPGFTAFANEVLNNSLSAGFGSSGGGSSTTMSPMSASSPSIQIIDQRGAGAPDISIESSGMSDGGGLTFLVRSEVGALFDRGDLDRNMSRNFGLNRRGIRR